MATALLSRWYKPLIIAIIASLILFYFRFLLEEANFSLRTIVPHGQDSSKGPSKDRLDPQRKGTHPIDRLIRDANHKFKLLLEKRSSTLKQAASRYRERRGRHPPPGFDAWFDESQKQDAVIVEEFFDRIYRDINPFWAFPPEELRLKTHTQPQMIRVRQGIASYETDGDAYRPPWIQHWADLVTEIAEHLPDIDMVINHMDENRLLVPWEVINSYMEKEQKERKMPHPDDTISTYGGLAYEDALQNQIPYDPHWISGQNGIYWDHLRATCPPGSPIHNVTSLPSFDVPIEYPKAPGPYTFGGYVQNFTASQDPCLQPHMRGMHGTFIESVSMSTSHELFSMFAGSKLLGNNEILIPGAMYLTEDPFYSGGDTHGEEWGSKKDRLIWRGAASGGRNKPDSWWHFHRHRWVQMMNGTSVAAMEAGDVSIGQTFRLPTAETYSVPAQKQGKLGSWLQSFADVGFVVLECVIAPELPGECEYTTPYYKKLDSVAMKEQYGYKYLPDVDGNSFSARWRGFLLSTSMPLKATIYSEWHDDRIMPWVHFVPFDSSYMDIYGIMEYFLNGHDLEAERIAIKGKQWADSVYRREDMRLYVWRLLLEYARVVDDRRDWLAFVDDIR